MTNPSHTGQETGSLKAAADANPTRAALQLANLHAKANRQTKANPLPYKQKKLDRNMPFDLEGAKKALRAIGGPKPTEAEARFAALAEEILAAKGREKSTISEIRETLRHFGVRMGFKKFMDLLAEHEAALLSAKRRRRVKNGEIKTMDSIVADGGDMREQCHE